MRGFREMRHGTQDGGGGVPRTIEEKKQSVSEVADADSCERRRCMRQRFATELKTAHHRILLPQLA